MGSSDKSKKRIQLWKKAAIHFSLCFVAGFFTGFAPTTTTTTTAASLFFPKPPKSATQKLPENPSLNRSLISKPQSFLENNPKGANTSTEEQSYIAHLLIIVTTIGLRDAPHRRPLLMRLAHTLRLVPSPLLWVVVEAQNDAPNTEDTLRRSGIMYRHVTYKDNFTDADTEADFSRNLALSHVEYHRLDGIVHFADVYNTYDLQFFDELRGINVFGAWPVVKVSANRRRVAVQGPVCSSSKVVGWQLKDLSKGAKKSSISPMFSRETKNDSTRINISGFAFNSSVLWDPERWGRSSSLLDTSQGYIKFVQEVVLEDESKLKAIPFECSKIMLWHLQEPRASPTQLPLNSKT